ncbi:hypothetical protein L0F63_006112 [Massospora cicadina]|nr:hypothetical protein L0F63_006112 [Massospora cicadina]
MKSEAEMVSNPTQVGMAALPQIDLTCFLKDPTLEASLLEAKKVAQALIDYGCLVVREPRVSEASNHEFLDQLEKYYAQGYDRVMQDVRAEVGYQVGVTPPATEEPRCRTDPACQKIIAGLEAKHRPQGFAGPDPKWRYAWRIGKSGYNEELRLLRHDQVVPAGFPDWARVMDSWGNSLHQTVVTISEMAAVGLNLPKTAFTDLISNASHLLAPTGSDLSRFNQVGTVLAGFHYDLCFMTIHGKSRYPGLNIWAKANTVKVEVKVPDGYLLVQAGKQLQWVTGGVINAGYHEVIVSEATVDAIEKAKAGDPPRSLWRVSSTLFNHVRSDCMLEPLEALASYPGFDPKPYPKVLAHDYVVNQLAGINLFKG